MTARLISTLLLSAATLAAMPAPARAQYDQAILTTNNNCLISSGDHTIWVFACKDGGAQYLISNGQIRTADGLCFDHSIARGDNTTDLSRRRVKLVGCQPGYKSQVWYAQKNGELQNAANPDVCLDIAGGADQPGRGQVIVWPCSAWGNNRPSDNQHFYIASKLPMSRVNSLGLP